jgi:uncharacterized membrane protein (UPF0127 family)
VEHANSFLSRLRGLLGRGGIDPEHALVLWRTPSIHMFGMAFTIDVIFLDKEQRVVALFPHRRPFSLPVGKRGSFYAVEMADGAIDRTGVKVGDRLMWEPLA